ncbi:MAG: hypothetical protein GXP35_12375 [Actinobacteria bacterium]|nr:hypothetical protein [Actinomycetota bacterium]
MACANKEIRLHTAAGEIVISLRSDVAPTAVQYVVSLIDEGVYDGSTLYRSTTLGHPGGPRLVQGGPFDQILTNNTRHEPPRDLRTISEFETTVESGLRHCRGAVSLGRDLPASGEVIADMFFCLGEFPELDYGGRSEPDERGFPVFGEVKSGLAILDELASGETAGSAKVALLEGQILSKPLVIESASSKLW